MSYYTLGNLSRVNTFKRHYSIYWCIGHRKSLKVKTIGKLKPFDVNSKMHQMYEIQYNAVMKYVQIHTTYLHK